MKKIILVIVAILSVVSLYADGDLHLFKVNNKDGKITPTMIEEAFSKNGFSIGVNSEMNKPFNSQFKSTSFKVFTLLTIYHTELSKQLVQVHPSTGVFVPMGVGIYQSLGEDTLHVSVLTAEAQAKIANVSDLTLLKKIEREVLVTLNELLPDAKYSLSADSLKESRALITQYELELEGEDWEEAKDEFEMNLEAGFEPLGFVMPGFVDFNEEMTQEGTVSSVFDFYDTYSICKLKVIYAVSKTRPEASAFAPCTVMIYKKKDEDKIVVGFPAVYNWMSSTHVENKEAKETLMKAQNDFESILKDITE